MSIGNVPEYYWRVFSNIGFGFDGILGIFTLFCFLGVLTMLLLFVLSGLVARGGNSAKNRFMALMLFVEGLGAGFFGMWYIFPWSLEALPYLYPLRYVVLSLLFLRTLLFLSVPVFYIARPWTSSIKKIYQGKAMYLLPLLSFVSMVLIVQWGGGAQVGIGELTMVFCEAVGPGQGRTYFGEELFFEPYCSERFSALYPMTYSSLGGGSVTIPVFVVATLSMIFTAVYMHFVYVRESQRDSEWDIGEINAIRIGFISKTFFSFLGALNFFLLVLLFGFPDSSDHIFNEEWMQMEQAYVYVAFSPLLVVLSIFGTFVEGIVFTYGVIKQEIMGIDEQLRKTFSATLFAGIGGMSLLVGSEVMENLMGMGWVGGVGIGVVIFAIRGPLLRNISVVSNLLMPEAHTHAEQIYMKLFSVALEEGGITSKERTMLDLHADSSGIDRSRALRLEQFILERE